MADIERAVGHILDIVHRHIEPLLLKTREIYLLPLQKQALPTTLDEFTRATLDAIKSASNVLVDSCRSGEMHVLNLLRSIKQALPEDRESEALEPFQSIFEGYAMLFVQAILHSIKTAADTLRDSLFTSIATLAGSPTQGSRGSLQPPLPLFSSELRFADGRLNQFPSLSDFHDALAQVCTEIVGVAAHVQAAEPWSPLQDVVEGAKSRQKAEYATMTAQTISPQPDPHAATDGQGSNFVPAVQTFRQMVNDIIGNRELAKTLALIPASLNDARKDIETRYRLPLRSIKAEWLWDKAVTSVDAGPDATIAELLDYLGLLGELKSHAAQVMHATAIVGPFIFNQAPARDFLAQEIQTHINAAANRVKVLVRGELQELSQFIRSKQGSLQQKVSGIDELHSAVAVLNDIREKEIDVEGRMSPIEEAYQFLTKHGIKVSKEDVDAVDSLQYSWQRLRASALEVQDALHRVQPRFKEELVAAVTSFRTTIDAFAMQYESSILPLKITSVSTNEAAWKANMDMLKTFQAQFSDLDQKWHNYEAALGLFALPPLESTQMVGIRTQLRQLHAAYGLFGEMNAKHSGLTVSLDTIDLSTLELDFTAFKALYDQLPVAIRDWAIYDDLTAKVELFIKAIPLLGLLSNKSMKKRHWVKISNFIPEIRDRVGADAKIELRHLICRALVDQQEDVEDVCNAAVKEADIEAKLDSLANLWNLRSFTLAPFKNRGDIILKSSAIVQMMTDLEDSLMLLSSLTSNRFNGPFKDDIAGWVHNLSVASETIEQWVALQNLWIYLEAVFIGGDIAKQLPKEAKKFAGVDKSWCKIMSLVAENANVLACCVTGEAIRTLIPQLMEQLEVCQKSLSGYLESKRSIFPRFYFVSDPTLLEILGQASDSHTIQPHLKNVFDNVFAVEFHPSDYNQITGIESGEGEKVALTQPCQAVGGVEVWLGKLLESVQTTVNDIIEDAVMKLATTPLMEILEKYPAQIGIVILQIYFTAVVEDALLVSKGDRKKLTAALQCVTDVLNALIEITTRDLKHMERTKYETFITVQVHHRDVCETLIKLQTKSPTSFDWLRQCRFYWDASKRCCFAQITNFDFRYSCEYLGCGDRLVITPLTDRCYITLAQALGMSLGGSPAGPAGTGKTETVKDMGKALGKWVVVFNCSDQMDYRGLGRIFKGLAQSGCWGDFDEFNRIDLPVLSVAAQQIACVLSARRERKKVFTFTDGENVELNPDVGIFITMNPGYAGRVELPENLKTNFRYVAMMVSSTFDFDGRSDR